MTSIKKKGKEIIIEGLPLSLNDSLLLENGEQLEVNCSIVDHRFITQSQRRFIFQLCKDLSDYTGENPEILRATIMKAYETVKGIDRKSLMQYSETEAKELIDSIVEYGMKIGCMDVDRCLENGYTFTEKQTYSMCLKRVCCVCGKEHADIHHVTQIGTKGNRDKISHIGMKVLPLCRYHHTIWHNMGGHEFDKLYHTTPCIVDDKMERFIKKGVIKIHESDN